MLSLREGETVSARLRAISKTRGSAHEFESCPVFSSRDFTHPLHLQIIDRQIDSRGIINQNTKNNTISPSLSLV